MRQPDLVSTSALSFQPQRRTMANCRGNCQADMLIGKYDASDLEPVILQNSHHDLKMKQPTNISMFYGLSDS
ncbi:hypothetical protein [Vibrio salilacus]|uniref:hypothetical protein n=1 Tax=Vibrio salilacus TaxID=1323749 RepID=UPI000C2A2344|nr:hypothetical protein [Vibrio salilacus]